MADATGHVDTRTILFTDLVGSTELRVALGEDAADAARRQHDALLANSVTDHGGTVVKGLGDGIMATFGSAAEAVTAAVAIQQAVEAHGRQHQGPAFKVRIGLSLGDVTVEPDDVFGVPVVEASRLCAAANGGEILASDLVRVLARGRGGFVFEPVGDLELKGLPEPLPSCRVAWEPLVEPAVLPFPGALTSGAATSYVGREALLAHLEHLWRTAAAGEPRTALLAGEPGVGKTRTAAELGRRAYGAGALVLYGRCDEDLGVPYQPFVEALDWYVTHAEEPRLGRLPGELARVVPDLRIRIPGLPDPVVSDPRSEEHRLFESVASWLIEASKDTGAVVVLDDLHWAAKPTLALLLHVLRLAGEATSGARLLVVVTYRDTDVDRAHPLAGTLGDLRRLPGVERLPITGLNADEVVALVGAAAGHELDEPSIRLARAVHDETEGNPFFVGEVLRHLVEEGMIRREEDRWVPGDLTHLAVPEGVRDVVGRRLSRLSDTANEVLTAASVVGREIELDVLTALVGRSEDEVIDGIDEALRARLVEEVAADRFRFAHALVRSTLYEELSATRRRRMHRRVADVIEKLHGDDVASLAFHCCEGGPEGGDLTRAIRYTLAAAERAQSARAVAEAEARYRQVLDLLDDSDDPDPVSRLLALCGLGECQRDQGDGRYRETLLDAAHRALALGQLEVLVRAVFANSRGMTSIVGSVDVERVELIEAALDALGPEPSADRARLLASLSAEVTFAGDDERRYALADEAESMARALGDRPLLGWVIVRTAFAFTSDDRWREIVERSGEAVEIADEVGDPNLRVLARTWFSTALLGAGRFVEAERISYEACEIADAEGGPLQRWIAQSSLPKFLAARGDLDEAEAVNNEALALAEACGEPDGVMWWLAAQAMVLWLRGDHAALAEGAAPMAEEYTGTVTWRLGQIWALAEAGDIERAQALVDRHRIRELPLGKDPWQFFVSTQLLGIAIRIGDVGMIEKLERHLAPFLGCWGHYTLGTFGPLSTFLGAAAHALGRTDEGTALLETAVRETEECGAVALAALPRRYLAAIAEPAN